MQVIKLIESLVDLVVYRRVRWCGVSIKLLELILIDYYTVEIIIMIL